MDPETTYREYCAARIAGDLDAADDAARNLIAWLDRGGFYPRGLEYARDFNRFMAYVERRNLRGKRS